MTIPSVSIVWFRQDLRLQDNPALFYASEKQYPIIPLYILDETTNNQWKIGEASRWWLHQSLTSLNTSINNNLCFAMGDALTILKSIANTYDVKGIYWNRCYEPLQIKRDTFIKSTFSNLNVEVKSFNSALLKEPFENLKDDATSYKVFTSFYKKNYMGKCFSPLPQQTPAAINCFRHTILPLNDLNLLPTNPWYKKLKAHWSPGEEGAKKNLKNFLENGLRDYQSGRDYPSLNCTSKLSPHLHFGEISPRQILEKLFQDIDSFDTNAEHFVKEICWREFAYNLLYYFPHMPEKNLRNEFDSFSWGYDEEVFTAWKKGLTGYPIIDAGMRELWQTGYMHNRVRMIVGSFLVKNLLIDWRHGERWFWNTLVDADLANNSAGWQWVAGCGVDASPYFRIFNPVTQGEKFDSNGDYVKKYVPELSKLPNLYIHSPWKAPDTILKTSGITLGKTYPTPIVDLKISREKALSTYKLLQF